MENHLNKGLWSGEVKAQYSVGERWKEVGELPLLPFLPYYLVIVTFLV